MWHLSPRGPSVPQRHDHTCADPGLRDPSPRPACHSPVCGYGRCGVGSSGAVEVSVLGPSNAGPAARRLRPPPQAFPTTWPLVGGLLAFNLHQVYRPWERVCLAAWLLISSLIRTLVAKGCSRLDEIPSCPFCPSFLFLNNIF